MSRIVAVCSLCGHEYVHWFDEAETAEHMAEAHGMYFDPRPLRTLPPGERGTGPGDQLCQGEADRPDS